MSYGRARPTVGPGLAAAKAEVNAAGRIACRRSPTTSHLLYTFVTDRKPGDVTGEGVENFFVVSPAGNKT